ncbi:hypothetical protein M378DRAFT_166046 [Amanita muscaria Koide BX008]|uniref:PWWP domain-containing protein n=1 Tax=Amanita muscaria (strain Koide BX008) TaxID=946122 RepID=A0A0C2WZ98_AMAMK|nr:hypothetical protein M378DRAFT_166046 [Amanita muscaria Koide BX008]
MSTYKTRSATSRGATRTPSSHADQNNAASRKLRPISPEELQSWSDGDSDDTFTEPELFDLDEGRPYTFESGDLVWVKTSGGDWYIGRVSGLTRRKGPTREGEGIFYPVTFFDGKVRKYFAPLNGEIKPDTEEVRALLKAGGWFREPGGDEH